MNPNEQKLMGIIQKLLVFLAAMVGVIYLGTKFL